MRRKPLALALVAALLASVLAGVMVVGVAEANPWSVAAPSFKVLSPLPLTSETYHDTSVPFSVMIITSESASGYFKISLPIRWVRYSIDGRENVTITEFETQENTYVIDGGFTVTADSVIRGLSDGNHSLQAYMCDAEGVTLTISRMFAVCTRYPEISILSPVNRVYNMSDVPLTFFLSEPAAWIAYRVDDLKRLTIDGNVTLTGLPDGEHQVIVYATNLDRGTNASAPTYFAVDTAKPNVTLLTVEDKAYSDTTLPLTFAVNEPAPWMGYSLDGRDHILLAGNTTLQGLSYGEHTLIVYASDAAGNMGSSGATRFVVSPPVPATEIVAALVVAVVVCASFLVYHKRKTRGHEMS